MPDNSYYPETESEESPEPKDEQMEGETALIPKTLFAGKDFKPGDEIVLQILKVYEDDAEVKYAPEKKESRSSMDEAMDDMDGKYGMKEE